MRKLVKLVKRTNKQIIFLVRINACETNKQIIFLVRINACETNKELGMLLA